MNGRVDDVAVRPHNVLNEVRVVRLFTLTSDRHRSSPGRAGRVRKKDGAKVSEALVRVPRTLPLPDAVEPVVVAWRVDEGEVEPLKELEATSKKVVATPLPPLDVAHVEYPLQIGSGVHVID